MPRSPLIPTSTPAIPHAAPLRRALLAWYDRHQRSLPWRVRHPQAPNPYHVLVSEAMLQQTQVGTVIAYFQRFMDRFPTLQSLAQSDEQQVLQLWQGLGYYRRARHLHAAAQMIVRDYQGQIPAKPDQLLSLPGVGRYSAGAIGSIAFGQPVPVLDGNVARVLARWLATPDPINQPAVRHMQWAIAQKLVPKRRPGDFNQALMELGATVCTPRQPHCPGCPVKRWCLAFKQDLQHQLPRTSARTKPLAVTHHALAIQRTGPHGTQYLWTQRPERGLWSKLWQLPTLEPTDLPPTATQLRTWAKNTLNLRITTPQATLHFDHATSHRAIRFILWLAQIKSPVAPITNTPGQTWRTLDQLNDLPLANPPRRMVQHLRSIDMKSL